MTWPTKHVSTWSDLQGELLKASEKNCVFRGQGNVDWSLTPSFNRLVGGVPEPVALSIELQMILRFRSEAHLHLPPSVMPPDVFKLDHLDTYGEWLMLMQHYGAPTRLLDWTSSPYVAVYFAVSDEWSSDAAVLYFNPQPASTLASQRYGVPPDSYLDYVNVPAGDIRVVDSECLLFTAVKKMRTAREVAQQGMFTFTNRILANHQDAIASTCRAEGDLGRVVIPKALKQECLHHLMLMNVAPAALFPGVDGVCHSLRNQLRLAAASWDTA